MLERMMTCKVLVGGGVVSYLDSVDLVESTSESAIERIVLGRIVQLSEILLVEESLCRRPLHTLRAMFIISLLCPVGVDLHRLEGIHFLRSPTNSAIGFPATSSFIFPTTALFAANPGSY